jgi:hypothetical protein
MNRALILKRMRWPENHSMRENGKYEFEEDEEQEEQEADD